MNIPTHDIIVILPSAQPHTLVPSEVNEYIANCNGLGMIKLIRTLTGFSLIEAKQVVDSCSTFDPKVTAWQVRETIVSDKMWAVILDLPAVKEAVMAQDPAYSLNQDLLEEVKRGIAWFPKNPIQYIRTVCDNFLPKYKALEDRPKQAQIKSEKTTDRGESFDIRECGDK